MFRHAIVHAVLLSVWFTIPGDTSAVAEEASVEAAKSLDLAQASRLVVEQTNGFRKKNNLSSLDVDETLQATAKAFADFMARTDKYGHQADGRTPAQRATAKGYDYCIVRENIAYRTDPRIEGASQLADFFTQGWIDSPGHRENMLADYATETAVAISTADGVTFYAVQLFGRPRSESFALSITNRSNAAQRIILRSNGGTDELEIETRQILKMKRCFPLELSLEGVTDVTPVKETSEFTIDQDNEGNVSLTPEE